MIGTFKANNPVNNFLLLLYGIIIKLPLFLHPVVPIPQKIDGFLYKELLVGLQVVGSSFPLLYSLITFLLLYAQAILLNNLANTQKLFTKPNYLIGMSYLLMTSLFTDWQVLSSPLIISTIGIWVIAKMTSLYNVQQVKTTLFNIGLVIGIGTFFYFPSAAFILLLLFGLATIRPFKITEWLIAFLGAITPYYFLLAIFFTTDKWQGYKFPGVAITAPVFVKSNWVFVGIALILFTVLLGFVFVQQNFRRQLIQTRKSWGLVFLYLPIAGIIPFINATNTFSYWVLCAVPLSVLMAAYFFYMQKKWVTLITHWAMVGYIFAITYIFSK